MNDTERPGLERDPVTLRTALSRTAPAAAAITVILLIYGAAQVTGIGVCPLRTVFGLSCPGCGMSRAWWELFAGDLHGALQYHPLFWLPVPALLLFLFRYRIPPRIFTGCMIFLLLLLLAVYGIRMADPADEVVRFCPGSGSFFRIFRAVF